MPFRDVVRSTFEEFARASGLQRKAKSWYQRTDETLVVLTLTRAPYGRQYFLAVGIVLRALDADENPKQKHCQLQGRLDRLMPAAVEHRANDLFDLEFAIDRGARREELLALLRSVLTPVVEASATLDGLRSGRGRELVRAFTVQDEARVLLADVPHIDTN
jgi:hypothetical protein